ncbi:MAG: hypothetical protein HOL01_26415, partial [Planctomycetaceae bacterium]|nr:hypothetical protein [Planctomycetaceae bacterium]
MKRIQLSVIVGTTLLLAGLQAAANAQQPGGVAYGPAPQRAPVNMALYPIPYQPGHHGLRSHQYTHYDHIPQQPGSYT